MSSLPLFRPSCRRLLALAVAVGGAGCGGHDPRRSTSESALRMSTVPSATARSADRQSDMAARMLNPEPPFRYPAALYTRRVEANVTLRLYVDASGRVHPESTRVAEPSGHPALDSAAVRGSEALHFAPARRDGEPVGAPLLFPVHFRLPPAVGRQ